jgi:hypothetical protein
LILVLRHRVEISLNRLKENLTLTAPECLDYKHGYVYILNLHHADIRKPSLIVSRPDNELSCNAWKIISLITSSITKESDTQNAYNQWRTTVDFMFSIPKYPTEGLVPLKCHQPSDAPVTHFDVQSFSYAPVPQPNFVQSVLRVASSTLFSLIHGSASNIPAATLVMTISDPGQFPEGLFGSFVSREVPGTIFSHIDNEPFKIEINFDVEMTKVCGTLFHLLAK